MVSMLANLIVTFVTIALYESSKLEVTGRRYLHNDDFALQRFA